MKTPVEVADEIMTWVERGGGIRGTVIGILHDWKHELAVHVKCQACDGRGFTVGYVEVHPYQEGCGACNGEGWVPAEVTVTAVPAERPAPRPHESIPGPYYHSDPFDFVCANCGKQLDPYASTTCPTTPPDTGEPTT